MQQRLGYKMAAMVAVGLGLGGVVWVTDTAMHSGEFWSFHAISDCVFDTVTYKANTSSGSPAGLKLLAGDRLFGPIVQLKLTSGSGELMKGII